MKIARIMKCKQVLFLSLICLLAAGCGCNGDTEKTNVPEVEKDSLPAVNITVKRYEKALFGIDPKNFQAGLKKIQAEFALFLDGDLDDPENVKQLSAYVEDDAIRVHYDACISKYPDLKWLDQDLSSAFSLYAYWFPDRKIPKVYTYVSGGDFSAPIKNADSALIIALDLYLGGNYSFYGSCGVPYYKARWMDKPYIVRDCMEELGIGVCTTDQKDGNFLEQMVAMGKLMYFLDVTMPEAGDSIKLKYTGQWLDWCEQNEGNIWAFFIDNKLLYSKSKDDFLKFFADGPFNSSFGKDSPPRIAIWVGWRIVRAYMNEKPEATIKTLLLEKDAQKILQQSKYKPKK